MQTRGVNILSILQLLVLYNLSSKVSTFFCSCSAFSTVIFLPYLSKNHQPFAKMYFSNLMYFLHLIVLAQSV